MESSSARRASPPATAASAGLTPREQLGLAVLALERARRGAIARMHRSRLLRWRHRAPAAEDLLLAPPDLRALDAGFAQEVAADCFGLAGMVAHLGGRSPFAIVPPSEEWLRELEGFGWLRHLDAARSRESEAIARKLVADWIRRSRRRSRHAWVPELVARRILSWLAHAGLLLDGAPRRPYAAIMRSLSAQITYLSASWRNAPDGYPRLIALIALVQADLCVDGHERRLAQSEKLLAAELERQILADGGHLSRNPWVLVELLLDLLPVRRCFAALGETAEPAVLAAITRMTVMLRHLRLGDGMLARFNGVGTTERDALATVLAYAEGRLAPTAPIPSGYARLERGASVVIVDAGAPPPLELAGAACAGCLSFEMSTGAELLLVNAGAPGHADPGRRAVARATASHNTVCVSEQSSSKLIRNPRLEREVGGPPLRHPDTVTCVLREAGGDIALDASHDGYVARMGLVHARTLTLAASGARLDGVDRLSAAKGVLRFSWDLPFAIHFHLHPDAEAHAGATLQSAELRLPNGECWRLTAAGAAVSIEDSVYHADAAGPAPAQQIVLRGVCAGTTEVAWTLERLDSQPVVRDDAQQAGSGLSERLAAVGTAFDEPSEP